MSAGIQLTNDCYSVLPKEGGISAEQIHQRLNSCSLRNIRCALYRLQEEGLARATKSRPRLFVKKDGPRQFAQKQLRPRALQLLSTPEQRPVVPARVEQERERVLLAPRSLTAAMFGDPPPGRSALDKKRGIQ